MNASDLGIVSAACFLPEKTKSVEQVFLEEGVGFTNEVASRIGIERIHEFDGEDPSEMALEAARLAIKDAGIQPLDIDVIIDFSVLPQKYVVPAWSMSNKIQYKLAARNAFTLGFSGGGATNFHVALGFAKSLIRTESSINTILLVASDRAIPNNRIINREASVTVLSDASSAVVLRSGATDSMVLDTCLLSDGSLHDVSYVQGGGIAHPTRLDMYKVTLDHARLLAVDEMAMLGQLTDKVLSRHSLRPGHIKYFLFPNVSKEDQGKYVKMFGVKKDVCAEGRMQHGHIQATDIVLNYVRARKSGIKKGDYIFMVSNGMGFLSGVTLLRF